MEIIGIEDLKIKSMTARPEPKKSEGGEFLPDGAEIKPFVDVTVTPSFGDRKVKNKVGLGNTSGSDSFDARIANNALVNGTIGVNAVKGSHTFGLHYSVGGGNDGRLDHLLKAKYSYQF